MQSSENSQLNLDYAQELITYLKRRNLVLTIIWPILLAFLVLASLVAFYYYQLEKTTKLSLSIETEKGHLIEEAKQTLMSKLEEMTSSNITLNSELEILKSNREELSVLNNDSNSKLNITSQIVDNLNQLVSELKDEREDLSTKLDNSLEIITQLRNQYQQYIEQTDKEKSDSVAELNKQLDSRKFGYQALANRQQEMRKEMERLNNLVNSKEKQIDKINRKNQNLDSLLNGKNSEIETYKHKLMILEKSYSELESKINAIMSPIGTTGSNKQEATNQSSPQTDASRKFNGLEEIKKPTVKNKANDKSPSEVFDHNKISILP
ncbi:MAG: chromosome segregation ATPase [Psychroserpens sp.]|jgi:chromosome segregation ATPase